MKLRIGVAVATLLLLSVPLPASELDEVASLYVEVTLALGEYDADWVDAYYGPPEIRDRIRAEKRPLESVRADAVRALDAARGAAVDPADPLSPLRRDHLIAQLTATVARAEMLGGRKFTFEEEAKRLCGFVPPRHAESEFQRTLDQLERELPGEGALSQRLEAYRSRFLIPADRLDAVMRAAMTECRARTARWIPLPAGESFALEYVTGQPWGGYNWYRGDYHSLIQVNTDLPMSIDRAVGLACHEGYPGHHLYNALLEKELTRGRGWVEFSIYPLSTPQSLIAEGSANYGKHLAFPGSEAAEFNRRVLFPLAGIDPKEARRYERVADLTRKLAYVTNEVARRLLDGEISRDEAAQLLVRYGVQSEKRAKQQVDFIERYRSYVINYNLGEDLVRASIERHRGRRARWAAFQRLLSVPPSPGILAAGGGM